MGMIVQSNYRARAEFIKTNTLPLMPFTQKPIMESTWWAPFWLVVNKSKSKPTVLGTKSDFENHPGLKLCAFPEEPPFSG